jgi:hypothetical protein
MKSDVAKTFTVFLTPCIVVFTDFDRRFGHRHPWKFSEFGQQEPRIFTVATDQRGLSAGNPWRP